MSLLLESYAGLIAEADKELADIVNAEENDNTNTYHEDDDFDEDDEIDESFAMFGIGV